MWNKGRTDFVIPHWESDIEKVKRSNFVISVWLNV